MQKLIIVSAILALSAAAPGLYLTNEIHVPLGKLTVTKSSQVVDHGSTYVHHPIVPVVHTPVVHTPVVHVSVPSKTTVTKSSQVVNHGSTAIHVPVYHEQVHVPVLHTQKTTVTKNSQVVDHGSTLVHTPIVHSVPVVHTPVLVHSSPLYTFKSGDSAVSHHSSTVHETHFH